MPRSKRPEEEHHVKTTVSFDPGQYKEVIAYCERNERSLAWVIRKALADWLPKHQNDSI